MLANQLIRQARRRAGLSQTQLAGRLRTSQPLVARWEKGEVAPSFKNVVRAVRACGYELHVAVGAADVSYDPVIAANLRLTPEQRLEQNEKVLTLARTARGVAGLTPDVGA